VRPAKALSTSVRSAANSASETRPGTTHKTDWSSRSHAQKAKHPAISAMAAPT
jgi:hypothetical protein